METYSTINSTPPEIIEEAFIVMPEKQKRFREPGYYPDLDSEIKKKHNIYILFACKFLKDLYNGNGVRALILDGREMRTTKELFYLNDNLKELKIVEFDTETYKELVEKTKNEKKIEVFQTHIQSYVENFSSPYINVVYFDVISGFFSSNKTFGTESIIEIFLEKSKVDEIVLAATFCLRGSKSKNFEEQKKNILVRLEQLFIKNNFVGKLVIPEKEILYRGQRTCNKSMMFVLYLLNRDK
jgi:hypothetical protein